MLTKRIACEILIELAGLHFGGYMLYNYRTVTIKTESVEQMIQICEDWVSKNQDRTRRRNATYHAKVEADRNGTFEIELEKCLDIHPVSEHQIEEDNEAYRLELEQEEKEYWDRKNAQKEREKKVA
jgi:hypothetical protein